MQIGDDLLIICGEGCHVQSTSRKASQLGLDRGICMRTLLISALAASLAGCTCLPPPPQVMNEGTDQNGFACFGQTPVRPVIAPNPAVFQADPVRRKTRPPTVGKIDTPASTEHADKDYSVTKKQKFTMPSKLEAPTSTEPADKVESVTKNLKSTIAAKMEAPASTEPADKA